MPPGQSSPATPAQPHRKSDQRTVNTLPGSTPVNHILKPLKKALDKPGRKPPDRAKILDPVEELAFRIHGDRVNPQAIQLVVLSQIPLVAEVARFYSDAWAEHVAAAGAQPFEMLPPDFQTLDRLSAAEYRTLLRLPFDYLSPQDV